VAIPAFRACAVLALTLLAGCGIYQPQAQSSKDLAYHLTTTDIAFVNAIRANTQVFYAMDDANMALYGHDVCNVLRAGGALTQAAAMLPVATTVRAKADAAYFVKAAAQDYCPTLPTSKPTPAG
jgi:Protein of unknown function (DUF732)